MELTPSQRRALIHITEYAKAHSSNSKAIIDCIKNV